MSFAESLPQDPWVQVIDWLLMRGYADETVHGDINNKRSFDLETLVGLSGKLAISYVCCLNNTPTEEDIYAYWLRIIRVGGTWEVHALSRDTGYYGRMAVTSLVSHALTALESEIEMENKRHTERRRRGESAVTRLKELREFGMPLETNPMFVAPSPELRLVLTFFYDKMGGKSLHDLTKDQKRMLLETARTGLLKVQHRQTTDQHRSSAPGCFVGTTAVTTPMGSRDISSVRVGDVVLGLSVDGLEWCRVRAIREVCTVPISVETTQGLLHVTADHRLVGPSGATPAGMLMPGTLLYATTKNLSLGHAIVLDVKYGQRQAERCFNLYLDSAAVFIADTICAHSFTRLPWLRMTARRWMFRIANAPGLNLNLKKIHMSMIIKSPF